MQTGTSKKSTGNQAKAVLSGKLALQMGAALCLACTLAALTGCGAGATALSVPEPAAAISGTVYGGQAPIVGATISLMEAGITGYGSAPSVLSTTLSLPGGSFLLPVHSTCPTPDRLVYIQATGGNAGTNIGTNAAIDMVALLGTCNQVGSSTKITMNEATTISAAYALAQFASVTASGTKIGTSSTNVTGLNNALGPANLLVNTVTGLPNPTSSSAGVVLPTAVVNTLADVLAACNNSASASSSSCATLFSATTVNSVAPIDTFQAALNIALHPGTNVSTLFGLVSATGPFQPTIASATPPSDFTLAIGFNGGGIAAQGTNAIAIDAAGNAWVTDYYVNAAKTVTGLIEITPSGTYPGGATGFGNGTLGTTNNVAIDQQGHIWLATNGGTPAVVAYNPNGSVYYSNTGVINPNGIAIDAAGDAWYSAGGNANNQFGEFVNAGGGNYTTGPFLMAQYHFEVDVCITPQYVYTVSYGAPGEPSGVTQYNPANNGLVYLVPDSGYSGLSGCAVDNAGNLYLADFGMFNGIEAFSPGSSPPQSLRNYSMNTAPFQYQYTVYPQELALDGAGNLFIGTYIPQGTASYNSATSNPSTLVEFSNPGTLISPGIGYRPSTGQSNSGNTGLVPLTSQVIAPGGVAIDGSGNVWLAGNDGQSATSTGNVNTGNLPVYVTEVIGIAVPVVTPKSVALTNGKIATMP